MASAFAILAEPNRRAILSLLAASERSVGEIERRLRMPQPTVSKHLRVLRDAGFVEATVDAQRRLYRLKPEPLQEIDAWLAPFRRFWSKHLDALERHLAGHFRGLPPNVWRALGVIEIVGGVLLVVPARVSGVPMLTAFAAAVLAVESLALAAAYARKSVKLVAANT